MRLWLIYAKLETLFWWRENVYQTWSKYSKHQRFLPTLKNTPLCILFLTLKYNMHMIQAAQTRRWTTFSNIYVPDDRNSRNQVLGLVTSKAA